MARHVTARGEPIDMGALIAQNATSPALGNAKMNARGDILGKDGVILKTQEQIEAEWAAEKAKQKLMAGKPGNIKEPLQTMIDPNAVPPAKKLTEDQNFEPDLTPSIVGSDIAPATTTPDPSNVQIKNPRRRIVETE